MEKEVQEDPKQLPRRRPSPTFEELAAEQGVKPIEDFDALMGHPSPEDETVEEFEAMLRSWRREGRRRDDE